MRVLIQRVKCANITVDGKLINSIGRGLCLVISISKYDTDKDIDYMSRKVLKLRLFKNEQQRCTKNVMEEDLEILCISQITLYGELKTNSLDFRKSMPADSSKVLYQNFISQLRSSYKPDAIKDGLFGTYMEYNVQNDGYVICQLESPSKSS
ncbi:D-tyrosyl-tRNA(Tyr) deacylase 1 [Trichoplax sp. H2]|nr:D-tyrosyl-tRNA(Tyr) deacylase 1 [Trichoplax sp. H2]|eukprot:RDD36282.1 D-tyrosyl-tRNA(Tyr) deacylase 1 [Trichoplax sp. H2]